MFCPTSFTAFFSTIVLLSIQSCYGSKIIGGSEVKPHSMPFMALLADNGPACGGTLIHPSWVLTAAHCENIKKVSLGVHSIQNKKEKSTRQVQKVKKTFRYPLYDAKRRRHDLMLLKLNKQVKKTKTVMWLNLDKDVKDPKAGAICVVAGWGGTDKGHIDMSDVLKSVNVSVVNRKRCNSSEHYDAHPVITEDMICAGSDNADTCARDSGGPLLCNGVLVGITSFGGESCGTAKHPGVYTFLTIHHRIWIKKTIRSQNDE